MDDNLVDRCEGARRAQHLAKFGAPAIEDDASAGAEVYRALYVDGYGQDLPILAFERRAGQPPQAVFYGAEGRRLAAPLDDAGWKRIQREARFADQPVTAARPTGARGAMPAICLHSWVTTVEIANSALDAQGVAPVRRRTEDACTAGLTTQVAFLFAELAFDAFPHCNGIDRTYHRSFVHMLAVCASLDGDVHAAIEVQNALDQRSRAGVLEPVVFWSRYQGVNAVTTLNWNGEVVQSPLHGRQVAEFLAARQAALSFRLVPGRVTGQTSRQVTVTGVVERGQSSDAPSGRATYEQQWVWDPAGRGWTLSAMTVGPFATGTT